MECTCKIEHLYPGKQVIVGCPVHGKWVVASESKGIKTMGIIYMSTQEESDGG
jgi:hypothetical protein